MNRPIRASTPGKLMLAGEYAVLRPGGLAVAVAIARRLVVSVTPAARASFSSALLGLRDAPMPLDNPFVAAALDEVTATLGPPDPLAIDVDSALSDPGHPKSGLGSSAAFTLALTAALVQAAGGATRAVTLGVALRAHLRAQGWRGSGYDVVTSFSGGVTSLRTPGAPLARLAREGVGAEALVAASEIQREALPVALSGLVVASGASASTPALVAKAKAADPAPLAVAAKGLAHALGVGSVSAVLDALDAAQVAFERWSERYGLALMTPAIQRICEDARRLGLVPRVSGAGGGDSVLVFGADEGSLATAARRWSGEGRRVEPLAVAMEGLRVAHDKSVG